MEAHGASVVSLRPDLKGTILTKKSMRNILGACVGFIVFVGAAAGMVEAASGGGSDGSIAVQWSLEARLPVPESDVTEMGLRAATSSVQSLVSRLNARGVKTEVVTSANAAGGLTHTLLATGEGDVTTFRAILHGASKPELDLLGGVTELELDAAVVGSDLDLILESNLSTGYRWRAVSGSAMVERLPSLYEKHTLGYGVPDRQTIRLTRTGTTGSIKLVYSRSWEQSPATKKLRVKLSALPTALDLSNPDSPAGSVMAQKSTTRKGTFPVAPAGGLPASFDWRDNGGYGIVPAVRDQGACGSCWAFGTVGIMESALWKQGIANQDLSEQYLISCNLDGFDCNGGLTAHKYHYDTLGKNQTVVGAVYETDKPYTQSNGSCYSDYSKPYALSGWAFITPTEFDVPTDEEIKNAIYAYGPITAGVCAGDGWDSYSGGLFSTDETSYCGGSTNHQIILVGWDDPGQYWILRNSWGSGWGDGGYMYIKYGMSRVGEGTSWVTTELVAPTLTVAKSGLGDILSSPSGIDCGSVCSALYPAGTSIDLTATAASGYDFAFWTGACSGAVPNCSLTTVDGVLNVTANFFPLGSKQYSLSVGKTKVNRGTGSITAADGTIDCGSTCKRKYYHDTPVYLSARADTNSVFTGWSGACSGVGLCAVTMDKSKSVRATFVGPYKLKVVKSSKRKGAGLVNSTQSGIDCGSTCSAVYSPGTIVTLNAVPADGSTFTGWGPMSVCYGTGSCTVSMDKARTVTATFTGP